MMNRYRHIQGVSRLAVLVGAGLCLGLLSVPVVSAQDSSAFDGSGGSLPNAPGYNPGTSSAASSSSSGPPPGAIQQPQGDDQEAQDLREAAEDANDQGVEAYDKGEWQRAIQYFQSALQYSPDDQNIIHNYNRALGQAKAAELRSRAAASALTIEEAKALAAECFDVGCAPVDAGIMADLRSLPPVPKWVRQNPQYRAKLKKWMILRTQMTTVNQRLERAEQAYAQAQGAQQATLGVKVARVKEQASQLDYQIQLNEKELLNLSIDLQKEQ